jgi:hypothetical protein
VIVVDVRVLAEIQRDLEKIDPKFTHWHIAKYYFECSIQRYMKLVKQGTTISMSDVKTVRKLAKLAGWSDSKLLDRIEKSK